MIVISSAWHVRVPRFFALCRDFGLHVSYRRSFAHGSWPRMLAHELREARHARVQRRAAMLAMHPSPDQVAA